LLAGLVHGQLHYLDFWHRQIQKIWRSTDKFRFKGENFKFGNKWKSTVV
jgi:hypothetical protein